MTSNTDPPKATSWHSITKNTAKLSEMRVQPGYNGKTIDDESWNQLRESANTACLAIARHKGSDRCETYRSALVKHHLDVFSWQCYWPAIQCPFVEPSLPPERIAPSVIDRTPHRYNARYGWSKKDGLPHSDVGPAIVKQAPAGTEFLVTFGGIARKEAKLWNDYFTGTSLRCERLQDAVNGEWRFAAWVEGHTADELQLRKQVLLYDALQKYFALPWPSQTFLAWFMTLREFALFVAANPPRFWKRSELPQVSNRGQKMYVEEEREFRQLMGKWTEEMKLWSTAPEPPRRSRVTLHEDDFQLWYDHRAHHNLALHLPRLPQKEALFLREGWARKVAGVFEWVEVVVPERAFSEWLQRTGKREGKQGRTHRYR